MCGTASICIDGNSTGSYVDVVFTEPMIIKQVYYSNLFRLSDNDTEEWFAEVGDPAWSLLHNGSTISDYFATTTLTLWDMQNSTADEQWNISVIGCPASEAVPLSFALKGSFSSIMASFTSVPVFVARLTSSVARVLEMASDTVLLQSLTEDKRDPLTPRIDVNLQVLGSYSLTDTFYELLTELEYWTIDYTPHQCIGKICPLGQICFKAMCVATNTGTVAGNASAETPVFRNTTKLSLTEATPVEALGTVDRRYWIFAGLGLIPVVITIVLLVLR